MLRPDIEEFLWESGYIMQGKSLAWIQFNSVAGLYMYNVVAYLEFHNIFFRSLMLTKMKLSSAARLDIHINSPQKI